MKLTWRWFGTSDPITLQMMRQIGVQGVVTSLHSTPNGEVWSYEDILAMRNHIEQAGLRWSVVESLPVSEVIKYGGAGVDTVIDNYIASLENLGRTGIRCVCYNFMPVIDWIRTDLNHKCADGTTTLCFDKIKFAYFDHYILGRKASAADYTEQEAEQLERLAATITQSEKDELVYTIITKTQGFISGNFKESEQNPIERFNSLLALYQGVDRNGLRRNLKYFLERIMPVCNKWGIDMAIHPDDPPYQVLGLPRIVCSGDDIEWILNAVNNTHNGLTFCAGSLSAGLHNNVLSLAERLCTRTHFVHLRSTEVDSNGNFYEASHLKGRGEVIELVRLFERYNPSVPMRVDHGRVMLDDINHNYNPGYPLLGRMYAFAQVVGVIESVRVCLKIL